MNKLVIYPMGGMKGEREREGGGGEGGRGGGGGGRGGGREGGLYSLGVVGIHSH